MIIRAAMLFSLHATISDLLKISLMWAVMQRFECQQLLDNLVLQIAEALRQSLSLVIETLMNLTSVTVSVTQVMSLARQLFVVYVVINYM